MRENQITGGADEINNPREPINTSRHKLRQTEVTKTLLNKTTEGEWQANALYPEKKAPVTRELHEMKNTSNIWI